MIIYISLTSGITRGTELLTIYFSLCNKVIKSTTYRGDTKYWILNEALYTISLLILIVALQDLSLHIRFKGEETAWRV